jgi:tetratricopeptide (TPR) repeat protein
VTLVTSDGRFLPQRLDAWKAIAQYLGRTCRTVQRWHVQYGLPIHRLGGDKGPIFAYANELDDWMKNRGRAMATDPPEMPRPVLLHAPLVREDSARRNEVADLTLVTSPGRNRSAELVILAQKMWGTLSLSNIRLIARSFREAVDLDPFNAEAWIGLSQTLIFEGLLGKMHAPIAYPSAQAALERALETNSETPEAKCVAAWLKLLRTRDWHGARNGFDEALQRRPRTTSALAGRALLHIAEGCLQEASGLVQEAADQNPLNSPVKELCCWSEYLAGEHASALEQVLQARSSGESGLLFDAVEALASILVESPDVHIPRIEALAADSPHDEVLQGALGYACAMAGKGQRARGILDEMMRCEEHRKAHEPFAIALVLIGLNQRQEAVKRLEQSYWGGSLWSLGFQVDPVLTQLRNDPHYRLFLSKVSYPVPDAGCSRLGAAG